MRNRATSFAITVAALLAFALLPSLASADVRTEARRYFRQGMALIQEGDLDRGIAFLQQAYDTLPHPNVLYNIGRAYAEAGRYEEAIEYFQRYLDSDPPDREEVQGYLTAIQQRVQAVEARQQEQEVAEQAAQQQAPAEEVGPAATPEEIRAIEDSATQIAALAEATQSDALRQRADRLRRLAESLRHRNEAAVTTGGGTTGGGTTGGGTTGGGTTGDGTTGGGEGGEGTEGLELGGEASAGLYEEQVVSASRFAQSPLDAPNSTTMVTAQDIRLTGHTNFGALLRRAAGADVMQVAPGHYDISIRGLDQRVSNKLVVLIDGRSVYLDFIGATFWELLPVSVEDVERIEVIRGPASALYGADAFTGIVNIVTRDPGEGPSWVSGRGGSGNTLRTAGSVNGRLEGLSYRFGGGYETTDQFSRVVAPERVDIEPFTDNSDIGMSRKWFSGDLRYRIGDGWVARGGVAGSADATMNIQAISRLRDTILDDALFTQSYLTITSPVGLTLRTYWNHLEGRAGQTALFPSAINVLTADVRQEVVDTELSYSREFDLLVPHNLALGIGYRYKSIAKWEWLDGDHTQNHFSAYIQDILQLAEPLRVQLSFRADRHPLLDGIQFSPRGSIVYRLTEGSALRGTVGFAFRSPTFLESYLELRNPTPLRGVTAFGIGNTDLEPERITSFEVGYANSESDYFALEANAYYNLVDNQILFTRVDPFSLHDFADPGQPLAGYDEASGAYPVSTLQFENEDATFQQIGGEAGIRLFPVTGLDVYLNYAINDTSPLDEDQVDEQARRDERRTSLHKVNAGVQYRSTFGLDVAVDLHWVSGQVWAEQVLDVERGVRFQDFDLASYAILNARIGYHFLDDHLELGVVGTNLIDDGHREHPFGQPVDRRVMGTAMVTF